MLTTVDAHLESTACARASAPLQRRPCTSYAFVGTARSNVAPAGASEQTSVSPFLKTGGDFDAVRPEAMRTDVCVGVCSWCHASSLEGLQRHSRPPCLEAGSFLRCLRALAYCLGLMRLAFVLLWRLWSLLGMPFLPWVWSRSLWQAPLLAHIFALMFHLREHVLQDHKTLFQISSRAPWSPKCNSCNSCRDFPAGL